MADASAVSKEISAKLRGYEGLTAVKLTECPAILEALGTTDPAEAYKRFVAAIESLPDDKYTDALKNALRLDPSLPDSLTGRSGRRMLFGFTSSVTEETVKSWEARAIETLAQVLVAKPGEHLIEMAFVFFMEGRKLLYKSETRFWSTVPGEPGQAQYDTGVRIDTQNVHNNGLWKLTRHAIFQLQPDERPSAVELYTLFPEDDVPYLIIKVDAADVFTFINGEYEFVKPGGPYAAVELLGDEPPTEEQRKAYNGMMGYKARFEEPVAARIYGMHWVYGRED
jgi:hypothetical protein